MLNKTKPKREGDPNCLVEVAQRIVGAEHPDFDSVYNECMQRIAKAICMDKNHPGHFQFVPLPSEKRYRITQTRTKRLRNSFFPRAVAFIHHPTYTPTKPRTHSAITLSNSPPRNIPEMCYKTVYRIYKYNYFKCLT